MSLTELRLQGRFLFFSRSIFTAESVLAVIAWARVECVNKLCTRPARLPIRTAGRVTNLPSHNSSLPNKDLSHPASSLTENDCIFRGDYETFLPLPSFTSTRKYASPYISRFLVVRSFSFGFMYNCFSKLRFFILYNTKFRFEEKITVIQILYEKVKR